MNEHVESARLKIASRVRFAGAAATKAGGGASRHWWMDLGAGAWILLAMGAAGTPLARLEPPGIQLPTISMRGSGILVKPSTVEAQPVISQVSRLSGL